MFLFHFFRIDRRGRDPKRDGCLSRYFPPPPFFSPFLKKYSFWADFAFLQSSDQMQEADDFFSRCVVEGCSGLISFFFFLFFPSLFFFNLLNILLLLKGKMVSQDPAPYSLCDVCGALATDPPK